MTCGCMVAVVGCRPGGKGTDGLVCGPAYFGVR